MADFVAVIRKAVGNLSENTPENRAKVFEKARAAIRRQLEAINPPPAEEVIARQLDKLNAAIAEVESEHAEALPDEHDADALMAELEALVENGDKAKPVAAPERPSPAVDARAMEVPGAAASSPAPAAQPKQPVASPSEPEVAPAAKPRYISGDEHDDAFGLNEPREAVRRPYATATRSIAADKPEKRGAGKLIAGAVLAVLIAAGAYAAWSQRDTLEAFFGMSQSETETAGAEKPAEPVVDKPAPPEPTPEVAEKPAEAEVALATPVEPGQTGKFTQRLSSDGTESDPGPAPEAEDPNPVEGRSVAALTDTAPVDTGMQSSDAAAPVDEATAEEATAGQPVSAAESTAPASQPIGVAQKMFLYEERLDQQSPTVTQGTVVWSLVTQPDETGKSDVAIRGEVNDPDNGLTALITLKRNTDSSLPASHIIEVVFAVPSDFAGGSIDQVQRVALKQTEQDQGNPLIAVSAKITQDFYMIALNDLQSAVDENTKLMRQRNWIDIPVVYTNGRRALITLEKGSSGVEVFNQALDEWAKP